MSKRISDSLARDAELTLPHAQHQETLYQETNECLCALQISDVSGTVNFQYNSIQLSGGPENRTRGIGGDRKAACRQGD
jgi:hypothetical protein